MLPFHHHASFGQNDRHMTSCGERHGRRDMLRSRSGHIHNRLIYDGSSAKSPSITGNIILMIVRHNRRHAIPR